MATTASGSHQRCSRGDFAVTVGLAVAAAMFLFPALLESRMLARRSACQENMRELSLGISLYANSHGGNIPHVPAEGPEAFAGIFAVRLAEGHFVDRRELGRLLICPGTIRVGNHERDALFVGFRVPTQEELFTSPNEELAAWKRKLGGDFAYRVGYMSKSGRYCRWRNDRSPRSAILADAPSLGHEAFQSANHGGDGQNVLFADGHVGYLCQCPALACGDHLYKNRAGYRAAAIGTEDNVLVRSEEGPALQLIRALGPR